MQKIIKTHIDSALEVIQSQRESINLYLHADELLEGIDLSDIGSMYVSKFQDTMYLTIYLEKKDSKLVHKLAQKFDIKFDKKPSWDGMGLTASGKSLDKAIEVEINNYVPATCSLVTETVELTELEIEEARRKVPTVKKVTKVVCA